MQLKSLSALLLSVLCLSAVHAEKSVSVFLQLDGPSLVQQSLQESAGARPASVVATPAQRMAQAQARQAELEPAIVAAGGEITGRFVRLVNAIRVRIPESHLADLAAIPGVRRVQRAHLYKQQLETSVPWIGAPAAWAPAGGLTGTGIRIGIIDSGIDYLHADFGGSGKTNDFTANDSTKIEAGTFPTAKVVGGTDFVGDNYDASGENGSTTPVPDPDPLDTKENGHGSHVAGIASGLGVTKDGKTYKGPYNSAVDFTQFKIGPGVAPGAKLYALKIFGKDGSTDAVVDALDWATDPNNDGNFSDHLDVVNLSLGSGWGFDDATDTELEAVNSLAQLGCVMSISAGNDGNTHYILGSPGVAARAITVANSMDNGILNLGIQVTAPAEVAGTYSAVEGEITAPLTTAGPTSGQVVATIPADACADTLDNAAALAGKIALIDRGSCNFSAKILLAQAAGAIGVVMVNNQDSPPIPMGGAATGITIPGVMISKADGALLKAKLGQGLALTLSSSVLITHPEYADRLDDSSSRGPSLLTDRLKPDVAAPGSDITSVKSGSGSDGATFSGTSMAAPHITGTAALVKQAHPTWPTEDIKAAIMNTAIATHDADGNPYPESRTGAGRVRVDLATQTTAIVKADTGEGDISLSFGAVELAVPYSKVRTLRVVNHGGSPVTFAVSVSNTVVDTGVTLTPLKPTVTVPANGSATFDVRLDADPAQFTHVQDLTSPAEEGGVPRPQLPESSGEVWLTGGAVPIHVPWHIIARSASQFTATVAGFGVPAGDSVSLTLATRGTTGEMYPLVSVFQLGTTDASQSYTNSKAATDIVAVGATSDFSYDGKITNTIVYFGIAVAGKWQTPQRAANNYDIEIDLDNDGVADYTLINGDAGTFAEGDVDAYDYSNGGLETLVRDESLAAPDNLIEEFPYNALYPEESDTAPFANGVLIHSAYATDFGLGAGKTTFRYRAVTEGDYADQTSWVTFNAAKPVIDPTPYGIGYTPFFDEGTQVQFDLIRTNAAGAGSVKLLLLHQHNLSGKHHEVVTLNLSSPDTDADGLPDAWELAHFGDLSFGGNDDPDGDGVKNAAELAGGTDPFKLHFIPGAPASAPLQWFSAAGRFYTVERATDLESGFSILKRHVPAVQGVNSFTDPDLATGDGPFFYRLRSE
jgi:subtilisin family serine protease